MFSLIITIVSVALVTALALATIYYGGSAFRQGKESAQAATVVNQAQQIIGAYSLFKANTGRYPDSLAELVPEYLQAVPQAFALVEPAPSFGLIPVAHAAEASAIGAWQQVTAGVPTVVIDSGVSQSLCQQINLKVRGDDGILNKPYGDLSIQCYGADVSSLKIVLNDESTTLPMALPEGQSDGGRDAVIAGNDWTVSPDATPTDPTPPAAPAFAMSLVDGYLYNGYLHVLVDIPLDITDASFTLAANGEGTSVSASLSYADMGCTVKKGSLSQRCSSHTDLGGANPSSLAYTLSGTSGGSSTSVNGVASPL